MTSKIIFIDAAKCNNCGDCETVCAVKYTGLDEKTYSRIKIYSDEKSNGFYVPLMCRQCTDSPCLKVCPAEAIFRDELLNRVLIDRKLCVGCRMCVTACPFGAMDYDEYRGRPFKCDLCEGNPECVRACEPKALVYTDTSRSKSQFLENYAEKIYESSYRVI